MQSKRFTRLINPFLQSNLSSFATASTSDQGPMTQEEKHCLLNDSLIRVPTPKQTLESTGESMNKKKLTPISLMQWGNIGGKHSAKPLRVLFDSGGETTMIHARSIPQGAMVKVNSTAKPCATVSGSFNANKTVELRDGLFPEFDRHRRIYGKTVTVFDAPNCPHDIILGRDFLDELGIVIDFQNHQVRWIDKIISMKYKNHWQNHTNWTLALDRGYLDILDDDDIADDAFILDAKYEATSGREVASKQVHLMTEQQNLLATALENTQELFDGNLGHYKHEKIHLEVENGAVPVHSKAYSVPVKHQDAFLKELRHLETINVLKRCGPTEWASPTFIIPKKDGRVRWISDLRELNKVLKRKVYPLPLIDEVVSRRAGYKFFTKLDLTMMYYSFELDDESKELCTIVTPYGKYQYQRMAMGLKPAPDVAQYYIEKTLHGLKEEGVEVYIDDVGLFSNSYEEHMQLIKTVVERLQEAGFKINPLKCEWCVQETDFLGHWLTPEGVKPWKKKVDAILKMDAPRNITELRAFLGAVTYYRHMWPRRSHLLQPLTALTGTRSFVWSKECDAAFKSMKSLMASDILMRYPDHNKPFELYTDASDYQMGAVIMQDKKPVAYWSRKLNDAQKNYSVMEKEMLAIVHCLKEFRSMLYGTQLTIFTDHKNLTFRTLNTQRVLRWRMYMEDFSPKFNYLPGKDNVLADCFSRLPRMEKPSEGKSSLSKGKLIAFDKLNVKMDPEDEMYSFEENVLLPPPSEAEFNRTFKCSFSCCRDGDHGHGAIENDEMLESFLNHPPLEVMPNPITMANIQQHQLQDVALIQKSQAAATWAQYPIMQIDNRNVICYRADLNKPNEWRIHLPETLVAPVIVWYHLVLGHRGTTSLYNTIVRRFYAPALKRKVESLNCEVCQVNKNVNIQYGHLPVRRADLVPWFSVAVDLIGPWKIKVNGIDIEFNALTCIDPVTNLTELSRIENKTSAHVTNVFENLWLSRYPKPFKCIHDQGGEFIGHDFQLKLQQWGIHDASATNKNPTANAICERMHQTVGNTLRTRFNNNNMAPNIQTANRAVDDALAACNHAMRCAVSQSLKNNTPGEVVFARDMLLNIPVIVDLLDIQQKRQLMINENLRRQNAKRKEFDYVVNGEVLIKNFNPSKLDPKMEGPYRITRVFTNGTVEIRRNHQVFERLNIRRLVPFRRV